MIKKLNPKHGGKSNGFLNNYFEQNCSDINKGKGAIWILTLIAALITGATKYFD